MKKIQTYVKPGAPDTVGGLRDAVIAALDERITPARLPRVGLERRSLQLPAEILGQIEAVAAEHDESPGRIVGGLVAAWQTARREPVAEAPAAAVVAPSGCDLQALNLRGAQHRMVEGALRSIPRGEILLAEGGTGVGKSRVIAAIAESTLRGRSAQTVIVTAPGVQHLVHLIEEWRLVAAALPVAAHRRARVVLGRGQFIDTEVLGQMLEEQTEPDPVLSKWLAEGCPAGHTPWTVSLRDLVPGLAGLTDDLRALSPYFPFEDCLLDEESLGIGCTWYEKLRADAHTADLLFCTHAMLCQDILGRFRRQEKTLLPERQLLLIDEADQLETALAAATSDSVALSRLSSVLKNGNWARLRATPRAKEALAATKKAMDALYFIKENFRLPQDLSRPDVRYHWPQVRAALDKLNRELKDLGTAISNATDAPEWRQARSRVHAARTAIKTLSEENTYGYVKFSPVHRLPSLTVGRGFLRPMFEVLWNSTPAAVLLSGTLVVHTEFGPSTKHIAMVMAIPPGRCAELPPEIPDWITDTPTLYLPSAQIAPDLSPPTGERADETSVRAWLEQVAAVLVHADATSAGGMLVLMTGYERARVLGEILAKHLADRLIVQDPNRMPMNQARAVFVQWRKRGMKPVWIATGGGAWTGLDLSDREVPDRASHLDTLLTDLVVVGLPFGLVHNAAQYTRQQNMGLPIEALQVALRLRQGCGRLVRRPGLAGRRLWVLDGRLLDPRKRGVTLPALRALRVYSKREEITREILQGRASVSA